MNDHRTSASGPNGCGDTDPVAATALPLSPDYGPQPVAGRGTIVGFIALVIALIGGLTAGVFFHEPILHALGRHQRPAPAEVGARKELWTCGMHPQVIQEKPGLCPICHMKLTPLSAGASDSAGSGERKIKYWWDPMIGPGSIADKPGKSAMGMDLVPVYEKADSSAGAAAVIIDPVVVQNMGVRVARVTNGPVQRTIRAVGYLEEAQPLVYDVNLRVSGWVEKLYANTVGVQLEKGDKLFDLYSPEVQVAVGELVSARRALDHLGPDADALARRTSQTLVEVTRRKLEQWGIDAEQVDMLAKLDQAPRTITFKSPISGHVTEKMIVAGSAVTAGDMAMRIVDHSTLWLDSQVYAQDQPFIKLGQKVTAVIEGVTGEPLEGEVIFVHPHVDPTTRTAAVRIALPNPEMTLRPGMYATAQLRARLAEFALLIPREAVIDTGTRQITFIAMGDGRFEPRNVKVGAASSHGMVEILDGLKLDEQVVTSGQFLLDAESRMREAIQKHLKERLLTGQGGVNTVAAGMKDGISSDMPMSEEARPSGPAQATGMEAGTRNLPSSPEIDAIFAPYLEIAKMLGAATAPQSPVKVERLVAAAQALVEATPPVGQAHAQNVLKAAIALQEKPLAEQRKLFSPLSQAVIAMADACPPSKAVGSKLYVLFCPMKKASWLQTTPEIANPYYATEMKECGEAQRTINVTSAK